MALFKKKSPTNGNGESDPPPAFEPSPEKARKWFEHAKTAAMSSNFDYALSCFANGLKWDPGAMTAHEAMFEAAVGYMNQGGKSASSREVKGLDDGSEMGKFVAAEFEWMKDLHNFKNALRALEMAVKAEQLEYGHWIAPKVFNLLRGQKKHSKSSLVQAMTLFRSVGAWDESLNAGEMARALDPSDNELDADLKNLSAQRAMDQGGYEQAAGEEGGFRKFIKDEDKQRELIEEESLAGGGSIEERNLLRAQRDYEANPASPDAINRYAQLLKKQGTPEAAQQALGIYKKGFEDTNEYRFRMHVGDIEIELLAQAVATLAEQLEATPDDAGVRDRHAAARTALLTLQSREYTERVARYPTDRQRKYQLGSVQYELGDYDEAMAQLQAAKDEPKLRVRAGHLLGRCFFAEEWYSEAISEYEEALDAIDVTERERELAIRYDLMLALLAAARAESSIDLAKQAKSICSEIARRDITYRDIRVKRKEVDEVIKTITGE
ncbi:MAG: hypothetical protein HKO59_07660 [Phycisphaerales bacterium]|nr:hypothetical protein [Phycisphaerales bacterium]